VSGLCGRTVCTSCTDESTLFALYVAALDIEAHANLVRSFTNLEIAFPQSICIAEEAPGRVANATALIVW